MGVLFSSPFSGTFSQFDGKLKEVVIMTMEVFVPFLGDFLSIPKWLL